MTDSLALRIARVLDAYNVQPRPATDTLDLIHALEQLLAAPAEPVTLADHARANARIMDEIRLGRKINAIKEARAALGLGLKEAKELVEQVEAEDRAAQS